MTCARKSGAFGLWLSVLAVYVQVLLPFVVVADLRSAEAAGAGLTAVPICHIDGGLSPGAPTGDAQDTGGGHSAPCPLCLALGAGAPYTAPAEPSIQLREAGTVIPAEAVAAVVIRYDTASNYDARAPPLNG